MLPVPSTLYIHCDIIDIVMGRVGDSTVARLRREFECMESLLVSSWISMAISRGRMALLTKLKAARACA